MLFANDARAARGAGRLTRGALLTALGVWLLFAATGAARAAPEEFSAAHAHGKGCGHYLVEGRWTWFPSAHQHSFECGHFFYDGAWHPFAPGHVHGAGCGHHYYNGGWNVFPEGHVHKAGCGHVFLDGEWRAGFGAARAPAPGVASGLELEAAASIGEEPALLEPRPPAPPPRPPREPQPGVGRTIWPVADEGAEEEVVTVDAAGEAGAAPRGLRPLAPAPAAATPAEEAAPEVIAPVAPPRPPAAAAPAVLAPAPVLVVPAAPIVIVGSRVRPHRGSLGIASSSDYGGRWDPGCDVRYVWPSGAACATPVYGTTYGYDTDCRSVYNYGYSYSYGYPTGVAVGAGFAAPGACGPSGGVVIYRGGSHGVAGRRPAATFGAGGRGGIRVSIGGRCR
jgi:hypothetical protein